MRRILVIPLALGLAAAVGYGMLRLAERPPYLKEMVVAGGVALVATLAAALPALRNRHSAQPVVMQVSLYSSTIHMVLTLVLAVAIALLFRIRAQLPIALWLLWFYWVSLAALAWVLISVIRAAPPANASGAQK
ncbi:MAG: hypothetical protein JWO87_654 [Phycisphaerales bacterium]|jgi:hypothetical protein|nr:hypothetical protein [Phycisphaerales bacterium]MDB5298991.1 hypothetical protein [Phycisphaerales bacterium]MDB5305506.1 hypothetical protein [Phycisphaerales bacterium]